MAVIGISVAGCGGRLKDERRLVSGVYARRAVVDGDAVYWVEATGYGNQLPVYEVRRAEKSGGAASTVARSQLEAPEEQHHSLAPLVAASRTFVYFSSRSTSRLFRAPKTGGPVEELHALGPGYRHVTITALAGDDRGVFVMQEKHALASKDVPVIPGLVFVDDLHADKADVVVSDACGEHLAADAHDVFWTESSSENYATCTGGRVMKAPKRGGPAVLVATADHPGPMALSPEFVFVVDARGLERVAKREHGAKPKLVVPLFAGDRIAVGANHAIGIRDVTYPGRGPEQDVVIADIRNGKRELLARRPTLAGAVLSEGASGYWFRSAPDDRNDVALYRFALD